MATDLLKLAALDEEDLKVVSAHVQDAVLKVGDLVFQPREKRFAAAMNRFVWERKPRLFRRGHERRRSALVFDRVVAAQASGIDRSRPDDVLSLLTVGFEPDAAPAGSVTLIFAGGAMLRLRVECIEARLTDLGAAWGTASRPKHD